MKINNQITADIRFLGSSITQLKMSNNIVNLTDNMTREFGMDINVADVHKDENEELIGLVILGIVVEVKNKKLKKQKTKIEVTIQGCFKSDNPNIPEQDFIGMLFVNGGSTLYSIARSFVCNISATSYSTGKLLLPMVNVVEFLKKKISEEKKSDQERSNKMAQENP